MSLRVIADMTVSVSRSKRVTTSSDHGVCSDCLLSVKSTMTENDKNCYVCCSLFGELGLSFVQHLVQKAEKSSSSLYDLHEV